MACLHIGKEADAAMLPNCQECHIIEVKLKQQRAIWQQRLDHAHETNNRLHTDVRCWQSRALRAEEHREVTG